MIVCGARDWAKEGVGNAAADRDLSAIRYAALRQQHLDLAGALAQIAEKIAAVETSVAAALEHRARLLPAEAGRLMKKAQEARDFAEHERQEHDRWQRVHDEKGQPQSFATPPPRLVTGVWAERGGYRSESSVKPGGVHKARKDPVALLVQTMMIRCPKTGVTVATGHRTDKDSFAGMSITDASLGRCPACGDSHRYTKRDAFLADYQLPMDCAARTVSPHE